MRMGVFTYENENSSTVAPAKLYKALVLDSDDIIPKAIEACHCVEIVEGNGGPGTVKKLTFVEGGKTGYVLHKVEAVDEANFGYNYSIVGGDGLADEFEKISFECKLVPTAGGGCVGKITVKYFTKADAPPSEDELKVGKARGDGLFRAIEGFVLANPDY